MRSAKKTAKPPRAKLIKPVLVAALVVVIGMILVYFVVHIEHRPSIPPETKEIAQQKIEVQEKVDFFDFKGKIKVKAARRYLGEDNLYHLVGPVEIVDQGKKGGGEVSIAGDSVVYDKDMKHFVMGGKVKVRSRGVLLEAENFDYNREEEIFTTESGLVLSSSRLSGSAKKAVYSLKENSMTLEDDVEFKIIPRLENSVPLEFKADKVAYSLRDRKGRIESQTDEFPVSLVHGKSHGRADLIEFEQFYDVDDLKSLFLKGRVKVSLEERENVEPQKKTKKPAANTALDSLEESRGWDFLQSEKQEIEAEEIKVRAFLNLPELHAIESSGRSSFKFISSSGEQTHVRGGAVDFIFNRGAKLREFRVSEDARISSFLEDGRPGRVVEGQTITLDGETRLARVLGKQDVPASFTSQRNEVAAAEIEISSRDDSFGAKGGVKAVLRPQRETSAAAGFFAKDKPIFANALSVRYSAGEKRFILSGQAKMWQDKEVLLGQEVSFNEETGEMQGQGDIRSFFPHTPKEGEKEERVEISADRLSYVPKDNQAIYEGGKDRCSLIMRNIILRAVLISVLPGKEAGSVRSIRALKSVTIIQEAREAAGETADYDVEADTLVLTGRPVLTLKDKGTIRGDKLTFRLADGTILVENQDQQRSVAVIKS